MFLVVGTPTQRMVTRCFDAIQPDNQELQRMHQCATTINNDKLKMVNAHYVYCVMFIHR